MKQNYKEFLQSDDWKKKRCGVLIRDKFVCKDCGDEAACVHHLNYSNILNISTCISLCHRCHAKRHNKIYIEDQKYKGWANSINIKEMAEEDGFTNCPKCGKRYEFYNKYGNFCCYNCKITGGIRKLIELNLIQSEGGKL
jgi:hypothetical protein